MNSVTLAPTDMEFPSLRPDIRAAALCYRAGSCLYFFAKGGIQRFRVANGNKLVRLQSSSTYTVHGTLVQLYALRGAAHSRETGLIVLIFRDHEFLLYDPVKNAGLSRKRGKIRYVSVEKISMETIIFQVGTHQVTSLLKSRTGQSERSRRNSKTMDL